MPRSSSKSGHKSGHKSSRGSKSGSGPSSSKSKSRRGIFEFKVSTNPSSMIQRNQVLNPYLICSLTAQGVDDIPEVNNMSAVAMLMDMSGEVVKKENCIQNYNVSPQEAFHDTTEEGGSASGSSDTRYFYFYFDTMTVDPDPGDYYFEIGLYDWSSVEEVTTRATTTSSSFSVV